MAALNGFLALGNISADGATFTEITGATGYSRKAVALVTTISGVVANDAQIAFSGSAPGWPAFSALAIYRVATGGTPMLAWRASAPQPNDRPPFKPYVVPAGGIELDLPSVTSNLGTDVIVSKDFTWTPGGVLLPEAAPSAIDPRLGVAQVGDSRTEYVRANLVDISIPAYSTRMNGYQGYLKAVMRGRCEIPLSLNFGKSGASTTQIIPQYAQALATEAGSVIYFAGTNDRTLMQPFSTTRDNIDQMVDTFMAAGRNLVLIAETPRGPTRQLTGDDLAAHYATREHCLSFEGRYRRLAVVDPWLEFADPTSDVGDARAGYLIDDLHLAPFGNYRLSKLIQPALERLYPERNVLPVVNGYRFAAATPKGNLVTNSALTGTTGSKSNGATGDVATGWTLSGTAGATVVGSKFTDAEGKVWQQIDVSGTPTGSTISLQQNMTIGQFTAGDMIQATAEIEIVSAGQPYRAVQLGLTMSGGATVTANEIQDSNMPQTFTWRGIYRGEPAPVPSAPTLVRISAFIIPVVSAVAAITIRVRAVQVQKVV